MPGTITPASETHQSQQEHLAADSTTVEQLAHLGLKSARWWERRLVSLLGLPFDVLTLDEAILAIRRAVVERERLFLSTPNVNFAMAARKDPAFRSSVLHSDLVVADGMPLVWLARLAGLPLRERVTGSDIFDRLLKEAHGPAISVYFFGGPPGAAEAAAQHVNQHGGPMKCVGWQSPGFISLDELSQTKYIEPINQSGADFVVVALGAAKGQAWIMRNRHQLNAPVLSHLGAVVNFTAGTLKRAPVCLQRIGFEWAWRILQEPELRNRYWNDGKDLFKAIGEVAWTGMSRRISRALHFNRSSEASQISKIACQSGSTASDSIISVTLVKTSVRSPQDRSTEFRTALAARTSSAAQLQIVLVDQPPPSNEEWALLQIADARIPNIEIWGPAAEHQHQIKKLGLKSSYDHGRTS